MCCARARLGRLLVVALFSGSGGAGCGGKVTADGDSDGAPECTHGVQAVITGELDGTAVNAIFDLDRTSLSRRGEHWALEWQFHAMGHAIATGIGPDDDEVETGVLFVTPQAPPFEGAILTATARLRVTPLQSAVFSALRRVGWCPGSPIQGELTFGCNSPSCSTGGSQPDSALLFGHLDGVQVNEPGWRVSNIMTAEADGGVRRAMNVLSNRGLALVEWAPESSAGVIAFPETGSSKAVLCIEQLAQPLTTSGTFHATALSLAGQRPGEAVSGELSLLLCVDGAPFR